MADPSLDVGPELVKAQVKGVGVADLPSEHKHDQGVTPAIIDTDDDSISPTEEELETLRRVPGRIPWICFTIAFVELCERFAYYGTTAVRKYHNRISLILAD